jgi:predicted HicB family RNase H-like nuclease
MDLRDSEIDLMIKYKGYICHFAFDEEEKLFNGHVANSHYQITFQGKSVYEIQRAFQQAIDEHISWCTRHKTKYADDMPSF